MSKGFLFATSNRKIKSYVVESQIKLLVWSCSNHLQKNIGQLITWSFLMLQSVSFISAAFKAFAKAYLFFSICLGKNNADLIKFIGIFKKCISENKIYFCSRKKIHFSLNKKVIFVFQTIFKLDFITQIIYCIIHRWLYSHFILFCSLISVYKKWNIEIILTFPYPYNWPKLTTTKWMKKKPWVSE